MSLCGCWLHFFWMIVLLYLLISTFKIYISITYHRENYSLSCYYTPSSSPPPRRHSIYIYIYMCVFRSTERSIAHTKSPPRILTDQTNTGTSSSRARDYSSANERLYIIIYTISLVYPWISNWCHHCLILPPVFAFLLIGYYDYNRLWLPYKNAQLCNRFFCSPRPLITLLLASAPRP